MKLPDAVARGCGSGTLEQMLGYAACAWQGQLCSGSCRGNGVQQQAAHLGCQRALLRVG